jgi:hypothetical protein
MGKPTENKYDIQVPKLHIFKLKPKHARLDGPKYFQYFTRIFAVVFHKTESENSYIWKCEQATFRVFGRPGIACTP